jgi:ribonuclease HII
MSKEENPRSSYPLIAGLDEVGYGALAGPMVVVVTAFRGPQPEALLPITDSKKLSKKKREELAPVILRHTDYFGFGWADSDLIDDRGVTFSWNHACMQALEGGEFHTLLVDGNRRVRSYKGEQMTAVKGDLHHWQISAASIVAKVMRDQEMTYLHEFYPAYGWDTNSGYGGAAAHKEALGRLGATPFHREHYLRKMRAKGAIA